MRSEAARALLLALALAGAAPAGCALPRTIADDSVVDVHGGPEAELDFWDGLAERRVVTNDDMLHALLLLAGEEEVEPTYAARVARAQARGWLRTGEAPVRNETATVGLAAVAVCDILGIRGGLTMSLLGPSPRYCTRELVFMKLIPLRSDNQAVSGLELIDLVNGAQDFLGRAAERG